MDILTRAYAVENYIIDLQQYFHENAERSGQETVTMERIKKELSALGIPFTVIPKGGIIGTLEGKKTGKTLLLRADIDGLPADEDPCDLKGKKAIVSHNPGAFHGCGHDGHAAMLLGAAKILKDCDFNGTILLVFEEGEENYSGAPVLVDYLELNRVKIDACFFLHLLADLKTGCFFCSDGPMTSGIFDFRYTLTGRSGHGSRPDQANNPIDCYGAVYAGINALRQRTVSPFEPFSFSVTSVNGGNAFNVIPDQLTFTGSVRYFDMNVARRFREALDKLVFEQAAVYGCEAVSAPVMEPRLPIVNVPDLAAIARRAWEENMPEGTVLEHDPWMASESMALFFSKWPGAMGFVGIENPEKGCGAPHHNGKFKLDEDALKYGAAVHTAFALEFLK